MNRSLLLPIHMMKNNTGMNMVGNIITNRNTSNRPMRSIVMNYNIFIRPLCYSITNHVSSHSNSNTNTNTYNTYNRNIITLTNQNILNINTSKIQHLHYLSKLNIGYTPNSNHPNHSNSTSQYSHNQTRHLSSYSNHKSPYDILHIKKHATSKEIKIAYYKLAKEMHPDLHHNESNKVQEE